MVIQHIPTADLIAFFAICVDGASETVRHMRPAEGTAIAVAARHLIARPLSSGGSVDNHLSRPYLTNGLDPT